VVWGNDAPGFPNTAGGAIRKTLESSPLVESVDFTSTGAEIDLGVMLRNFNTAIAKKADLIIVLPISPAPFVATAERAQKAGIPVVAIQAFINSPGTVNVGPNLVAGSAEANARMFRIIGEKGNVLRVQGIAGTPPDNDTVAGEKLALKNCPNVKIVGEVYGEFSNAGAKSQTLKYLGTHPTKIDGVSAGGTMAAGVMSAFQQAGRPMPVVVDTGPTSGSMAYWDQHEGEYFGVGTGLPVAGEGEATANVALRILEGQGPKLNFMTQAMTLLTEENRKAWTPDPDASFTSAVVPEGPPNSFLNPEYLNEMFVNGAPPKTKD
jgi:ribose transport system substrate-binding protein